MRKLIASLFVGLGMLPPAPSPAQPIEASQRLGDLLFLALDHGVDSVRQGGPLVPFVIAEVDGKRSIDRFVAEPYEMAVAEARMAASKLSRQSSIYALAYDGFVTIGGDKYDAIIVHGAERGNGKAYLLAQRYVPAKDGKSLEVLGNPVLVGREDALFNGEP